LDGRITALAISSVASVTPVPSQIANKIVNNPVVNKGKADTRTKTNVTVIQRDETRTVRCVLSHDGVRNT
jgi:hypothetical protein